jgi:hypothetical protein
MAVPVITIKDSDDSEQLTSIAWGTIDKGDASAELTVRIWNNYGGATPVDDAINCALTVKTYTGLNTGDTTANGQEVVTDTMISAKCTSRGDAVFTPIGGTTTLSIGNGVASTTLAGAITTPADQVSTVVLKIVVPSDAVAASITFKLFLLYS